MGAARAGVAPTACPRATLRRYVQIMTNPTQHLCFVCNNMTDPSDSFRLRGSGSTGTITLHTWCAERHVQHVLERLESVRRGAASSDTPPTESLSPRQLQILEGLVKGERDREIARRLGITENTVKNHAYEIRQKLGVRSRAEAAVEALRRGLVVEERAGTSGACSR